MKGLYYKDNKLFFDKELTQNVPNSNPAYSVLKSIKIPAHLTDVVVYEQTLEEAVNGLMFVGLDSKGRKQYFYGKNHVKNRNEKRNKIFINVYLVINKINNFIDNNLSKPNKDNKDFKSQLAVFMLMETSFFIRMGKMRYFKDNDTVGLLTLKNKHIIISKNTVKVKFVGKKCIEHEFVIRKSDRLYEPILALVNKKKPDDFLFNKLNEKKVYDFVSQYNIRVKDLRTYGVNYTFLYNFWSNVQSITPIPPIKKLISISLSQTADTVGHTPSMSKNAYMANTVLDLVKDKSIYETINSSTFDEFLNHVIDYVKNTNVVNG
ncbi:DNA topoisomerase type I [Pteropox virus]|uniref:DNA topoisomerase n=1 Tax=Pteropox virus TaxID=1873698 RepID=A0A1B1MRF7_9POXV|nr:DNA topoisomerase type I [Pteropox virus]ANS71164.1 DNA topoisomerase type I [Pteropox virus]